MTPQPDYLATRQAALIAKIVRLADQPKRRVAAEAELRGIVGQILSRGVAQ